MSYGQTWEEATNPPKKARRRFDPKRDTTGGWDETRKIPVKERYAPGKEKPKTSSTMFGSWRPQKSVPTNRPFTMRNLGQSVSERIDKAQRNRAHWDRYEAMRDMAKATEGKSPAQIAAITSAFNKSFDKNDMTANQRATNASFRDRTSVYRKNGASVPGGLTQKELFRQKLDKLKFNEELRRNNRFLYDETDERGDPTGKKIADTYETPADLRKRMFPISPQGGLTPMNKRVVEQPPIKEFDGVYTNRYKDVTEKPSTGTAKRNPKGKGKKKGTKVDITSFYNKKNDPMRNSLLNP